MAEHVLIFDMQDGPYLVRRDAFYTNFFPDILRGHEPFARYRPQHGPADIQITEIYSFFALLHMHTRLLESHNEYRAWATQFMPDMHNEDAIAAQFDWSDRSIHQLYSSLSQPYMPAVQE
jgi:hypothetical protein